MGPDRKASDLHVDDLPKVPNRHADGCHADGLYAFGHHAYGHHA
jgi:hypothetical protein